MEYPLHFLIPFLPFLLNRLLLPSPELNPLQILAALYPSYYSLCAGLMENAALVPKELVYSSVVYQ
jgi:hypothetical protein